jgi:pimeloyl-ACP methyl ester carboxylesterase
MSLDWAKGRGQVAAGGKQLEWASWGDLEASKPVIVMLHEGLGCVAMWRDFPAQVAQATGCPVFAYSRAGYGQSDPATLPFPIDYMTHEAVDVLPDILNAIGAETYVLMGHSDGATIAAEYVGRVEDFRVRGVILMAPHFFTEPMGLAEIKQAGAAFQNSDMATRMGKYHRDPVATFRGWNDAWLNPLFKAWDVSDVIGYIRIPALVIQGVQDQYGTRAQVDAIAEQSYAPVDVAMLDDCRHSPHIDQPQMVLEAVSDFTARLIRIEAALPETA